MRSLIIISVESYRIPWLTHNFTKWPSLNKCHVCFLLPSLSFYLYLYLLGCLLFSFFLVNWSFWTCSFFLSFFLQYFMRSWNGDLCTKSLYDFSAEKGCFLFGNSHKKKRRSCKIIIITVLENKNGMESNPGSGGRWRGMFDTEEAFYFKKNSFVMCKKKKSSSEYMKRMTKFSLTIFSAFCFDDVEHKNCILNIWSCSSLHYKW